MGRIYFSAPISPFENVRFSPTADAKKYLRSEVLLSYPSPNLKRIFKENKLNDDMIRIKQDQVSTPALLTSYESEKLA